MRGNETGKRAIGRGHGRGMREALRKGGYGEPRCKGSQDWRRIIMEGGRTDQFVLDGVRRNG